MKVFITQNWYSDLGSNKERRKKDSQRRMFWHNYLFLHRDTPLHNMTTKHLSSLFSDALVSEPFECSVDNAVLQECIAYFNPAQKISLNFSEGKYLLIKAIISGGRWITLDTCSILVITKTKSHRRNNAF